jgi:hypothetical protein
VPLEDRVALGRLAHDQVTHRLHPTQDGIHQPSPVSQPVGVAEATQPPRTVHRQHHPKLDGALVRHQRHEPVGGMGQIPGTRAGAGEVPVDERHRPPSPEHRVVVGHVVVADHLATLGRRGALPPPAVGQVQANGGVVQPAQQPGDLLQHPLRPQLGRGRVVRHLPLQVGEDLPALRIQAEHARRCLEAGCFQVPQQPVHRRRPRAGGPPDRGAAPPTPSWYCRPQVEPRYRPPRQDTTAAQPSATQQRPHQPGQQQAVQRQRQHEVDTTRAGSSRRPTRPDQSSITRSMRLGGTCGSAPQRDPVGDRRRPGQQSGCGGPIRSCPLLDIREGADPPRRAADRMVMRLARRTNELRDPLAHQCRAAVADQPSRLPPLRRVRHGLHDHAARVDLSPGPGGGRSRRPLPGRPPPAWPGC